VGLYSGTRAGAICGAALQPTIGRGWIDVDRGVFYRRPPGQRETNKRQPPVPLPPQLLAHVRRWKRCGQRFAVEWNGKPVKAIEKAFAHAVAGAGLGPEVTPHVLRHTAATWLMQGLMDMLTRMEAGRFKAFKHLNDWWEEFRLYHRQDGKVVKECDDLMSATRYAVMMLRYASTAAAYANFGREIEYPKCGVA
jgi:hypothetical protein